MSEPMQRPDAHAREGLARVRSMELCSDREQPRRHRHGAAGAANRDRADHLIYLGSYAKVSPAGILLQWYHALFFASPEIVDAAFVSLKVATAATFAGTMLATAAAIAITASKASWARAADTMLMSPLLLPSLALGLGLLLTFNLMNVGISLTTLIVGHTVICFPFVLRTTLASLSQIEPVLEECSRSFGAGGWFTFTRVIFPLARGGIGAGAFIAFMASFDNVAISLFLADAYSEVLPIRLWDLIENLLDVRAAAASGVLIAATVGLMILMERLTGLSRYVR